MVDSPDIRGHASGNASGHTAQRSPCRQCGYDLTGLDPDGFVTCPECGLNGLWSSVVQPAAPTGLPWRLRMLLMSGPTAACFGAAVVASVYAAGSRTATLLVVLGTFSGLFAPTAVAMHHTVDAMPNRSFYCTLAAGWAMNVVVVLLIVLGYLI